MRAPGEPRVEADSQRRQRTAEPAFAETHAGNNGEVHPAKEVHRAEEDTHPAKELPGTPAGETNRRRRAAAAAPPASRAWNASSSGRRTQAKLRREDAAPGAPARKGWWQRKLGGE